MRLKKSRKKIEKIHLGSSQKMWLLFRPFSFPLPRLFGSILVIACFGRFVTRVVQQCDKKNRAKISSVPKKSSYLLTSLCFSSFSAASLEKHETTVLKKNIPMRCAFAAVFKKKTSSFIYLYLYCFVSLFFFHRVFRRFVTRE
jgi:hypothetical protein